MTLGIDLLLEDFNCSSRDEQAPVGKKISQAKEDLMRLAQVLQAAGYSVQTLRIALPCFEEWNPDAQDSIFDHLCNALDDAEVDFCSIGGYFTNRESIIRVPHILSKSPKLNCGIHLNKSPIASFGTIASGSPDLALCSAAAMACVELTEKSGDLGNFRFSVSFNTSAGIPFFPASYSAKAPTGYRGSVSLGFESADLVFVSVSYPFILPHILGSVPHLLLLVLWRFIAGRWDYKFERNSATSAAPGSAPGAE